MELGDLTKPGEKKKLIWAGGLGLVAIVFLWWTFFGFGSGSKPTTPRATTAQGGLRNQPAPRGNQTANNQTNQTEDL